MCVPRIQEKITKCTVKITYSSSARTKENETGAEISNAYSFVQASATHNRFSPDPDPNLIFSIRFTKPLYW